MQYSWLPDVLRVKGSVRVVGERNAQSLRYIRDIDHWSYHWSSFDCYHMGRVGGLCMVQREESDVDEFGGAAVVCGGEWQQTLATDVYADPFMVFLGWFDPRI